MQKFLHVLATSVLVTFAGSLAGCASPTSPGEVTRNWSCKLREMQINPIFPPREDLHVGDMFWLEKVADSDASGYCKRSVEFMPIPPYVAYIDVTTEVSNHYKSRPNFPKTSTSQGTVTIGPSGVVVTPGNQVTDSTSASDDVFKNGNATRTRIVGFPDFMSVHVSKFALGAIVPIQSVLSPIGIGREDIRNASISIPVAESYSVPTGIFATKLSDDAIKTKICHAVAFLYPTISRGAQVASGQFHIVNEVFYTRAIDVNISASTALSITGARNKNGGVADAVPDVSSTGIVTESTTSGGVVQQVTKVSDGALQMLQNRGGVPGVSVAYEQGDSLSVSMRRIFDRPVAVGYRSITVEVTKDATSTCKITAVPSTGGHTNPMYGS